MIKLGGKKEYNGYKAYQYLEKGFDYKEFELVKHPRLKPYYVPLSKTEEDRFEEFVEKNILIDLHEHPVYWPKDMGDAMEMQHMGRDFTAYEALSTSHLDCVFDNLMDGMSYTTSYHGWKWTDVIHDIGIRLSDLHHQSMITHCLTVDDIREAHKKGKIA